MKCIIFVNIDITTIVGILTFISMIHTPSESLKAGQVFIFQNFRFNERMKFHAPLS